MRRHIYLLWLCVCVCVCVGVDGLSRQRQEHTGNAAGGQPQRRVAGLRRRLSAQGRSRPGRQRLMRSVKLKFHGTDTDTDTDILADFRARILARKSACPFRLPRAWHARQSSPTCPLTRPTRALFLARLSVRDVRAYTRVRALYAISYRVHVYKITRSAHP